MPTPRSKHEIPAGPVLDHIVILISHHTLAHLPPWLTKALTVVPGGTHADGLTENKLVVFQDGVYIELIAFVDGADPAKRAAHRWGRKKEGTIVDFACTMLTRGKVSSSQRFVSVSRRVREARAGFDYCDPVSGGRETPDGTVLQWKIAAPQVSEDVESPNLALSSGELPFWCLDKTPRGDRVPYEEAENAVHPCGAVGVAGVSISVEGSDKATRLRRVYDAITNEPSEASELEDEEEYKWAIDVPSLTTTNKCALTLQEQAEESPGAASGDTQIRIAFFTKETAGHLEGNLESGQRLIVDLIPLEEGDESWDWI